MGDTPSYGRVRYSSPRYTCVFPYLIAPPLFFFRAFCPLSLSPPRDLLKPIEMVTITSHRYRVRLSGLGFSNPLP